MHDFLLPRFPLLSSVNLGRFPWFKFQGYLTNFIFIWRERVLFLFSFLLFWRAFPDEEFLFLFLGSWVKAWVFTVFAAFLFSSELRRRFLSLVFFSSLNIFNGLVHTRFLNLNGFLLPLCIHAFDLALLKRIICYLHRFGGKSYVHYFLLRSYLG